MKFGFMRFIHLWWIEIILAVIVGGTVLSIYLPYSYRTKFRDADYVFNNYYEAFTNHDFKQVRKYVGQDYLDMLDDNHVFFLEYMGLGRQLSYKLIKKEYSRGGFVATYGIEAVYEKYCTIELVTLTADLETKVFKVASHRLQAYQPQDMKKGSPS